MSNWVVYKVMLRICKQSARALLASLVLASITLSAQASDRDISWLTFSEINHKHWRSSLDIMDSSKLLVTPNDRSSRGELHKILVIVAKKSGSYKLAMNRLLEVFQQEKFLSEFEVININRDETVGRQLLSDAQKRGFDLIFTMGSESAALVHRFYRNGPLPVVTAINKDPVTLGQVSSYKEGSGTNIATTSLNVPIDIQLNYLFELNPGLKHVALLYNKNHKQVVKTEVLPFRQAMEEQGIRVIDVTVNSREEARAQLSKGLPEAVKSLGSLDPTLKHSLMWMTSSTAIFSNLDMVSELSNGIPIVSTNPNAVREGRQSAAVAIGIDRRNNAHLAAVYALRILRDGVDPGSLEVGVVTPPDIALNFLVARELGLKVPFTFLEGADFVYGYKGELVRSFGQNL
ncbi:ABC transporter substrate binding protein [Litoribrevibacter albus]|uniref:ABC transporter substrate binding protein n=1 Tax=Litoribrevibacter albus TaxID=1473156 RepID=UPI0024E10228|nr:ABC transporter substrate binding protein [Litoribrevibacter albus]